MSDPKKKVVIVGDHPHVGRIGEFTGLVRMMTGGPKMARIEFEDGSGCFAKRENLMKLPKKKGKQ